MRSPPGPAPRWQLAQVNVGRLQAPHDDPQVAGFFAELDRINALAEASDGFVWRLKDEGGNATGIAVSPDPQFIVNLSVWRDAEALFRFVYRSAHTPVMAQRRGWFERSERAYQALWWVDAGLRPTIEDGLAKLWLIDRFGSSAHAFDFKTRLAAPALPTSRAHGQPDGLAHNLQGLPVDHHREPWHAVNA